MTIPNFLPYKENSLHDVTYYHLSRSDTTNRALQIWTKPLGCTMVYFFGIGGGGGGCMGVNNSTGGGGGGSGYAGGIIMPSFHVPNVLGISIGVGSFGSTTSGTLGTRGQDTSIHYNEITRFPLFTWEGAGGGGSTGGSLTAHAGDGGTWRTGDSTWYLSGLNEPTNSGTGGGFGVATGDATAVTQAKPVTGGGGGGGTTNGAGGGVTSMYSPELPSVSGGGAGGRGSDGYKGLTKCGLMFYFGAGGGGGGGVTGGRGGDGSIGCGGGGGGRGTTTNGTGGDGGPGMLRILAA